MESAADTEDLNPRKSLEKQYQDYEAKVCFYFQYSYVHLLNCHV